MDIRLILAGLTLAGCGQETPKISPQKPAPKEIYADNPPDPQLAPEPAPRRQRSQYIPPEKADRPQVSDNSVFHHRLFEGENPVRASFPVSFHCDERVNKCYFALGAKYYSFSSDDLKNNDPIALNVEADFSATIDPAESQITAVAKDRGYHYALFDGAPKNLNESAANAGIAIQSGGTDLETFIFPNAGGAPVSCPKNLFVYHNLDSNHRELWVTASNCSGGGFREGSLFVLDFQPDGTLRTALPDPLIPTQYNPQALAGWNAGDKAYVLAVNTGKTVHPQAGGAADSVVTEGGVDVIDAQTRKFIANIPLGLTAANSITISGDNTLAFLSSQVEPKLYALDLEHFASKLRRREPDAGPQSWPDVVIADGRNAIPMNWPGDATKAFYPEVVFDDRSKTVIASSFNDGRLYQVLGEYQAHEGLGVELHRAFGTVVGHFVCAGEGAENCGEVELIHSGLLALTGHPAGLTFIPNFVLNR